MNSVDYPDTMNDQIIPPKDFFSSLIGMGIFKVTMPEFVMLTV